MSTESVALVRHPRTGEVLDLRAISADTLLEARDLLYDGEREVLEMRRPVDDEIVRRLDHEGRRSFTFSTYKVEVNAPLEKDWDLKKLQATLDDFVADHTLSREKALRCIRWKPEAAWSELKTLLSDPRVREQIEACYTEQPANRYVLVTRRG